jgi:phage FluMu protein Com
MTINNRNLTLMKNNRQLIQVLEEIKNKNITSFQPCFEVHIGFHYKEIMFRTIEEQIKFLEKLKDIGVIIYKKASSILQCNSCKGYLFCSRFICNLCRSPDLVSGVVIEHDGCQNIDFDYKYVKTDGTLRCEKCNKMLNTIGVDYSKLGTFFKCATCNTILPNAEQQYLCLSCGKACPKDEVQISYLNEYIVDGQKLSILLDDLNYMVRVVEELEKFGIKCSFQAIATGTSGTQHSFDFIAYDKYNNPILILDTIGSLADTSDSNETLILSFIGRCLDLRTSYRILVTLVDLEENLKTLATLNNVILIRASTKEEASPEIIQVVTELLNNTIGETIR